MSLRAVSTHLLSASRDGVSTISLGSPFQPDHHLCEEIIPDVQLQFPLETQEAIASHPIIYHLRRN